MNWAPEKASTAIKTLVKSYPAHRFVIDVDELCSLNLPAKKADAKEESILDELRIELLETKGDIIELIEPEKGESNEVQSTK